MSSIDCPGSLMPFNNSCLKYVTTPKQWNEATDICASVGAHQLHLYRDQRALSPQHLAGKGPSLGFMDSDHPCAGWLL